MTATAREEDEFGLLNKELEGQIRIVDVAGIGGFSVVYRGWHSRFEGSVAVKCLKVPPSLSPVNHREYLEKFRTEAKILFKLQHLSHNIVHVYSAGEFDFAGQPVPYIVLGWLDGMDLERWLEARGGGPLALPEVVELLDCAAEALSKAHAAGIAKAIAPSAAPGNPTATHVTLRAYTRRYAAPEQRDSTLGPTRPATDVFSLALVAVELLTGVPALGDDDHGSFYEARREDVRPTPRSKGVHIPEAVEAVFRRALAVNISERYADAAEFWLALCTAAKLPLPAWFPRTSLTPPEPRPDSRGSGAGTGTQLFTPDSVPGRKPRPGELEPPLPGPPLDSDPKPPMIPPGPPAKHKRKNSGLMLLVAGAVASLTAAVYLALAAQAPDGPQSRPSASSSAPAVPKPTVPSPAPTPTLASAPPSTAVVAPASASAPPGAVSKSAKAQPSAPAGPQRSQKFGGAHSAPLDPCATPDCGEAPPSQPMRLPD